MCEPIRIHVGQRQPEGGASRACASRAVLEIVSGTLLRQLHAAAHAGGNVANPAGRTGTASEYLQRIHIVLLQMILPQVSGYSTRLTLPGVTWACIIFCKSLPRVGIAPLPYGEGEPGWSWSCRSPSERSGGGAAQTGEGIPRVVARVRSNFSQRQRCARGTFGRALGLASYLPPVQRMNPVVHTSSLLTYARQCELEFRWSVCVPHAVGGTTCGAILSASSFSLQSLDWRPSRLNFMVLQYTAILSILISQAAYIVRDPQVLLLELGSPAEFLDRAIEPPPPKMLRAALRNLYDLQVRGQYGEMCYCFDRLPCSVC